MPTVWRDEWVRVWRKVRNSYVVDFEKLTEWEQKVWQKWMRIVGKESDG